MGIDVSGNSLGVLVVENDLSLICIGDMVMKNSKTGQYAVWEAKGGRSQKYLNRLSTDSAGLRQGTRGWVEDRLRKHDLKSGSNPDLAGKLRGELEAGNLRSFASLYGSSRTFELDLNNGPHAFLPTRR